MKILAIIPARSGSKGLKDKNVRLLENKPLLAYTVEAAIKSHIFTEVMVSTESEEYGQISRKYGAKVPFLRSDDLSTDQASSWDVVREVIMEYQKLGKIFDICVLLQPTSPLRNERNICDALAFFYAKKAEAVSSVCEVDHPVEWCFEMDQNQSFANFAKSPYRNMRRQQLKKTYRENGAIYIFKTEKIMDKRYDIYSDRSYAFIMDRLNSIDIDSEEDFYLAEAVLNLQRRER